MATLMQVSLRRAVKIEGINIFNGRKNHAVFHPSADDTGIVFRVRHAEIPATLNTAFNYRLLGGSCVAVQKGENRVVKVEHLLSVLYGLGINNAVVELSDGVCPRVATGVSSYVEALGPERRPGTAVRKMLTVKSRGDAEIIFSFPGKPDRLSVRKANGAFISYEADYPHRAVRRQAFRMEMSEQSYRRHIMSAKPIFFLPLGSRFLVDWLHPFHGINDHNSLLIGRKKSPRYANRCHSDDDAFAFVRHKIMDALGTIALTGYEFSNTEFLFYKTGHSFDLTALRALFVRNVFESCSAGSSAAAGQSRLKKTPESGPDALNVPLPLIGRNAGTKIIKPSTCDKSP